MPCSGLVVRLAHAQIRSRTSMHTLWARMPLPQPIGRALADFQLCPGVPPSTIAPLVLRRCSNEQLPYSMLRAGLSR